jgi:hypothetical protein
MPKLRSQWIARGLSFRTAEARRSSTYQIASGCGMNSKRTPGSRNTRMSQSQAWCLRRQLMKGQATNNSRGANKVDVCRIFSS